MASHVSGGPSAFQLTHLGTKQLPLSSPSLTIELLTRVTGTKHGVFMAWFCSVLKRNSPPSYRLSERLDLAAEPRKVCSPCIELASQHASSPSRGRRSSESLRGQPDNFSRWQIAIVLCTQQRTSPEPNHSSYHCRPSIPSELNRCSYLRISNCWSVGP